MAGDEGGLGSGRGGKGLTHDPHEHDCACLAGEGGDAREANAGNDCAARGKAGGRSSRNIQREVEL